ncbi:hypothetical protein Bca4012_010276 [Brassica carinata]
MSVELLVQQPGREHLPVLHPNPRPGNGISRSINQMMYSMLRTGYPKWSVIPSEERELWFRQFAKPRFINGTVWEQLIVHWEKDDTVTTSRKNSKNRKSDRGGKGMYVHNLGACSMSSKEDQLTGQVQDPLIREVVELVESQKEAYQASQPLSDDGNSTGASTTMSRLQINEMAEKAVPKRKGAYLVGLARRASSYPTSSSQAPYADPMILEQLHSRDERIVALEEQNATILAELADSRRANAEILEKLDRLFPSGP